MSERERGSDARRGVARGGRGRGARRASMPRVGRPRGLGLSRDRIAGAALALVDAEGAGALSARRLAAALGCEAMSLYHHMAGMDDILDAVVDALLGSLPAPAGRGGGAAGWRKSARALARAYLALADAHPRAFVLVATRRWRTPAAFRLAAECVAIFQAAGFSPRAALRAARTLGAYLNGAGLAAAAWRLDRDRRTGAAPAAPPGLAAALNERAVRADLEAGLDALIDTLDSMV